MKDRGLSIVTLAGDAHAKIVVEELARRGYGCHVFSTDQIFQAHAFSAVFDGSDVHANFTSDAGITVPVKELGLCWWRRIARQQQLPSDTQLHIAAASNEAARHAFTGGFLATFRGRFVSDPIASGAAENKLIQLRIATEVGLNVPETVVSNSLADAQKTLGATFIAKSLGSVLGKMIEARFVDACQLDESEIRLVPTIFQRFVPGSTHIRAIVLGDEVYCVEFNSPDVDWRWNVPASMKLCNPDSEVKSGLIELCRRMGLRMGIADLKYDLNGELFFLELNPQGQFLFVDDRITEPIRGRFAEFLLREAESSPNGKVVHR